VFYFTCKHSIALLCDKNTHVRTSCMESYMKVKHPGVPHKTTQSRTWFLSYYNAAPKKNSSLIKHVMKKLRK